jgi:ABC-2 type transport system permease protein
VLFSFLHPPIRTFTFIRKEIIEILRQPRLLLTLVIGPFLILLLFGLGYHEQGRVLKTLFVLEKDDPAAQQLKKYAGSLGHQVEFAGITNDESQALRDLRSGKVDLVVVAPRNAEQSIRNNQRAVFNLYHNEIDPYQAEYIKFTGELYISKLNDQVLNNFAEQRKSELYRLHNELNDTLTLTHQMRLALEQNQIAQANDRRLKLQTKLASLEGVALSKSSVVEQNLGKGESDSLQSKIADVRATIASIPEADQNQSDFHDEIEGLKRAEEKLTSLEEGFKQFKSVDTKVLLSPFATHTEQTTKVKPQLAQYFAPSVIILLLQHLAVTFAALSMVKEFRTGTVELFQVSPLRPSEMLLGKYIGYLLVGGFVATVLSGLLIYALKVPMLGSWIHYVWVVILLMFTSLGFGFVISLISKSDSQAVQYSMILLLTTIFFSGFLLNLKLLWEPVRAISWALPATYGILLLQNVMLRGFLALNFLSILASVGVVLAILSLLLLRRRMAQI